ncbi:hypothetical protein HXX76_009144 [Chlamydomonas incerta]|uniref:Uncharacterized protein n=1 Tax=Chlamydomonas incerta TaxID=51695 RepID=A0A835T4B7_CHLIN|nr:hypothetical protein HXX76_009144 [Chlamydomonas incerta]|eukprot:KAG2432225.1 hypothetical protein HXX76_009144 [Chlamydomonas incerta]
MLQLAPELIRKIASSLPPGDAAYSFKLTCKEVAACLHEFRIIRLQCQSVLHAESYELWDKPELLPSGLVAMAEQPWPGAAFAHHWGRPEPWRALSRRQRHRVLCLAASSLHPPSLEAALAHCGTVIKADALTSAAAVGDVAACERLLLGEGCCCDELLVWRVAAGRGQLKVCQWLFALGVQIGPLRGEHIWYYAVEAAAFGGHREVLDWIGAQRALVFEGQAVFRGLGDVAGAAGKGGHVALQADLAAGFTDMGLNIDMLGGVAYGCPLAALRAYRKRWEDVATVAADVYRQHVLLYALASPTPDWADKAVWLLSHLRPPAGWAFGCSRRDASLVREPWWRCAARPDFAQRLEFMLARGFRLPLRLVATAAAAAGNAAAVDLCLGLRPEQVAQPQQPEPESESEPDSDEEWEAERPPRDRTQQLELVDAVLRKAVRWGRVGLLQQLRARGFQLPRGSLRQAFMASGSGNARELEFRGLPCVRYAAAEAGALAAPLTAGEWSRVFRAAARRGADLELLRCLREQHGAAIDLVAVATGGSEEALEWAAAELEVAGQMPRQPLSVADFRAVLKAGNWAAADWLLARGLAPTSRAQLRRLFLSLLVPQRGWRDRVEIYAVPALRWVVDRCGLGAAVLG